MEMNTVKLPVTMWSFKDLTNVILEASEPKVSYT